MTATYYPEEIDLQIMDLQDEVERLRAQNSVLQSREAGYRKQIAHQTEEIGFLRQQNDMFQEAIDIAERNAMPEGTAFTAAVPWDDCVSEYRRLSKVRHGPVPDDLREVLAEAEPAIREAMLVAAEPLITKAVRKVVRKRRAR